MTGYRRGLGALLSRVAGRVGGREVARWRPLGVLIPASVRSLLVAAGIALSTISCGSDSPSEPRPAASPLECEAQDYPCSLSEVPIEILQRADALGDEAVARLEGGAATSEVAAWLEGQAGMAVVEWDHAAIWYRLDGAVGIWVLREGAFAPEVLSERLGGSAARRQGSTARRLDGSPTPRAELGIVGPESQEKRALVLSPFHWHVPDIEDTPAVAGILSATRGYEGRVTHLSNEEETSTTVGLGSFMEWDGYDVVHVSTHGSRVCGDGGCRATLVAGLLAAVLPPGPGSKAENLQALDEQGVSYAKSERTGREYLVLSADFFRYHYPGGLEDALVFINACESFGPQATDLVDAIRGSSSVVFGWSETVRVTDATAAATALYQALAKGYPAEVALEEIEDLAVGQAVEGAANPELRESPRGAGGDLRIREVVTLLHPVSGEELTAADVVPIEGTVDDGEPDAVPWLVRVDGVKPELADGMVVRVLVAGAQSDPVPLTEGQANDEDQWTVSGTVLLPFDLTGDMRASFGARLDLHEGGVSQHETDATLSGEGPTMGQVWELVGEESWDWQGSPTRATARLTLQFAPGQAASEPRPRYIVTGGTVTYDDNHTFRDCTFTAPVITFDVPDGEGGTLIFDTTTEPVRYHAFIHTEGPEFEGEVVCSEGDPVPYTWRADNVWVLVQADAPQPVSADRRSITGTESRVDQDGFHHQRSWTITRVE